CSSDLETLGGVTTKLIERNTTIPVTKRQVFTTAADSQTAVTVHVLQGEREFAKDNRTLGQFNLEGLPPAPRGVPQVEVAFDIDANGIVHVTAKDLATGKQQKIRIESSSGLSEAEVNRMVRDAEAHAREDGEHKRAVEVRNNGDSLLYNTEKLLRENGDKIDPSNKAAVESALDRLREALKGEDVAVIETAIEGATQASHKLAEAMYASVNAAHAQQAPGEQAAGPEYVKPGREGSMDADFTVVNDRKNGEAA
ncbi:MAG: molecular chaperone DnaK, partial [Candidatus Hydrogenedentes bacterium]|nr:molecular chaperone DnaK [Candidatus Hydrogenedentota bacterium]